MQHVVQLIFLLLGLLLYNIYFWGKEIMHKLCNKIQAVKKDKNGERNCDRTDKGKEWKRR
jgi:hypothetical protein